MQQLFNGARSALPDNRPAAVFSGTELPQGLELDKITIMVNHPLNLSAYAGEPPASATASRRLSDGPLYEPAQVLGLVARDGSQLRPWTKKCITDIRDKLHLDHDGVAELVRDAINLGKYRNSEWCQGNKEHVWVACDAYAVKRKEWNPNAHKEFLFEYFVKFAIDRNGKLLLLISCHLAEERR